MSKEKTPSYRRFALAAGVAMALGPLTALSIASINSDDNRNLVAGMNSNPLQAHDSTRHNAVAYQGKRLSDVVAGSGSLDFFSAVLDAAELKDLLRGPGQYTVFIPVNGAFSALGGDRLSAVLNDDRAVKRLAKAHVVRGRVTATDLMSATRLRSINGYEITSRAGAELTVNGASVIGSEVAENGVVHYVDRLL